MIALNSVSVSYPVRGGRLDVLTDVTAEFEPGLNIGVLGHKGCGKTTLMRLIGAHIRPNAGTIERGGKVSWPITSMRPLAKSLSLRSNIQFMAALYGVPVGRLTRRVEELSELHGYLDIKVDRLPHQAMVRAAYSLCLAMEFDYYLADEAILIGDDEFRRKAEFHIEEMRGHRTLILASRNGRLVQKYCDIAYVLHEGKLSKYEDPREAAAALKAL